MAEDVVEAEEEEKIDLQQRANEALAGQVFEHPKEKKRISLQNDGSYNGERGGGNGKGRGKEKSGNRKEGIQNKDTVYLQKYYSARDGLLAEAVLIGGKPYFLISRAANPSHIEIAASVEPSEIETLRPPGVSGYINMPHRFDSETHLRECIENTKKETLDSLFRKNKAIWRKYVDADDFHISISAADEIYSYFQEKIGLTHYLFFTGGNNSGKSNNLTKIHYAAYRNMMSTDMTAANIYQFLGSREDEGHGTICEDEADNIDENPDKMRINKNGYTTGIPVLRTDTSFGRKQQRFNTFCFKAFAAERTPDPEKAKGFIQRIVEINCFAGNPPCDISEVVNPAGDQENQKLLDELLEFRNTLLIYKLLHFHEPIPDIKDLNIKNREKQLFKPLIRVFQNEECLSEILKVISEYISKKRAASVDSLHAYLYRTIKKMMISQNTTEFESSYIWQRIKDGLQGSEVKGKQMSYDTEDFGILSQKKVIGILKDVLGAEPPRHTGTTKKLIFNKNKFDRLDSVYNLELEIKVGRGLGEKNNVGLDKHIPPPPAAITAIHGSSASIADLDERGSVGRDTTSEQPPSSSSDFESDESDHDDIGNVKPKDDVTNVKEFIQIYDTDTEFSNNDQLKEKEITDGDETTDGVPSDNPLNATQTTQQQQQEDIVVGQNKQAFWCYYCSNFRTNVKVDYERHVIIVHPKKPAYPCKLDLDRLAIEAKGKEWEI
jgi:hypothetical protein